MKKGKRGGFLRLLCFLVEIARDARQSLSEFREGKLKIQTATEAIADLRKFVED